MRDVAELAGVSVKTVSNVLNDYPYIRPATRERVLHAVDELEYRLNTSARNLRRGRTGLISVALPELALPYFAELADEIIDAAEDQRLRVLIERTGADPQREREVLRDGLRVGDGLIFSPLGLTQEHEPELPGDLPLVLLGERIFTERFDHVTMQNVQAARAATTFLLEKGRRRVAVLGVHPGEVGGSAGLRLRGYLAALADAGLEPDADLQGEATFWHRDTGARAMAQVLDTGARPDAVLALNDALALGALHELQVRGIRVPDDVAVIGWDDIEEARYSTPSLTTVDAGRRLIAQAAVERLVGRIADPDRPPERLEMPYRIVERGSTGAGGGAA
ncbi:LacI family DNA-binding transcriptional regulator [Georgenia sp. H159]|uniref:LacI family DNA-binding transcriptional regulator n=1 Tax=Georgenia sp. H159 TaxID=3076115 RepID=UPI002D7920EB|nr:LacI family DNA-binding transcriptional regulator [Georgenia sp. H159]